MKKIILSFILSSITINMFSVSRGPIQPEYASFEAPNSTDMVNLSTGDFTYTLPLIKVPGSGGGYTMALSYHAGIELEEEASWVGLGWSLNPGAINRTVNQYPDDYSGNSIIHSSQTPGGHGYTVNWGVYSKYYDSKKGSGGRVGLGDIYSIGFGNDLGFTQLGVTVNLKEGKVTADPVAIATSITTVALIVAFPPSAGVTTAYLATSAAITAGGEIAGAIAGNAISGKQWDGNITNQNLVMKKWRSGLFKMKKNYHYYYKGSRIDKAYGTLYLGEADPDGEIITPNPARWDGPAVYSGDSNFPGNLLREFKPGAVSDVSYNNGNKLYQESIRPTNLAYDNYVVQAPGISGSISPYRLDRGSVVFSPTQPSSSWAAWQDNVSWSIKKWLSSASNLSHSYKTPFKYSSELSNSYNYHTGNSTTFDPSLNFDFSSNSTINFQGDKQFFDDHEFMEANRSNQTLKDGQLATGKYVQYFTNAELAANTAANDPALNTIYKDHLAQKYDGSFLSRTYIRGAHDPNGVGGFVITNTDGTSFHFTLPVYQNSSFYYSGTGSSSYYQKSDQNETAITWLLTGITGPDYIDRGTTTDGKKGIIDKEDWGYWVKFEYGKYSDNYEFRSPYGSGKKSTTNSPNKTDFYDADFESYYLNKVITSSHTALFIKSVRKDGKSSYTMNNGGNSANHDYYPSTTLRLDEVVIVPNSFDEHFFTPTANGGLGVTYAKHPLITQPADEIVANDHLATVLNIYDLSPTQLTELRNNQIRSIKFNYDYSLCQGTPNSFLNTTTAPAGYPAGGGKLTLKSYSVHGANEVKLSPDFEFDYGTSNPNYDVNKYDGWGFYSATASDHQFKHQATGSAAEWSLKKITTPTGSKILIDYERDSYKSLSGLPLVQHFNVDIATSTITNNTLRLKINSNLTVSDFISQNDDIYFNSIKILENHNTTSSTLLKDLSGTNSIVNVGSDYVEISLGAPHADHSWGNIISSSIYAVIYVNDKIGGDIRVRSIKVEDENLNQKETRYIYTVDGEENSITSGVCTMEPDDIHQGLGTEDYPQYNYYDYPGPAVLYSKVTVISNYKSSTDFLTKEIYEFEPPHTNLIEESTYKHSHGQTSHTGGASVILDRQYAVNVKVMTSKLARLNSITSIAKDYKYKKVSYHYEDVPDKINLATAGIGYFTEGTFLAEDIWDPSLNNGVGGLWSRLFQTLKVYTPSKMKSLTIDDGGYKKTITNTSWDYVTGAVEETQYENAYGDVFKTQMVPAYEKYPLMGHKLINPDNKHMLSQPAGSYLYVKNANQTNQWDLISAEVMTWDNQWKYREFNGSKWVWGNFYTNDAFRQKASYTWKTQLNKDGVFTDFSAFNYTTPANSSSKWISTSSVENYNHNSVPLNVVSNRGIYSSQQLDNSEHHSVLSAYNAKNTEVISSGAEDELIQYGSNWYYNNEVIKGSGSVLETNLANAHTGKYALEVEDNEYGFVYRLYDVQNELNINRPYQASIWVKNAVNVSNLPTCGLLRAIFKQGGSGGSVVYATTVTLNSSNAVKAGDWYLFTINIPAHNGSSVNLSNADFFEIQNKCDGNSGDKIYVDDFRFYPTTANITTSVYDYENGLKTAVLNNYNKAVKMTYDAAGRLIKAEKELFDNEAANGEGGFKVQTETKYNYGTDF